MKRLVFFGLPLIFAATPAVATGGFDCHTTDGSNIRIGGAVGHTIVSPLVTAHLQDGELRLSTVGEAPGIAIGRSWIDAHDIRLDLVDREARWFEAQLRARLTTRLGATGTLARNGRTYSVRCTIE